MTEQNEVPQPMITTEIEWKGEKFPLVRRADWTWREAAMAEELTGLTSTEINEPRNLGRSLVSAVHAFISIRRVKGDEVSFDDYIDTSMLDTVQHLEPEKPGRRPLYESDPQDPTAAGSGDSASTSTT